MQFEFKQENHPSAFHRASPDAFFSYAQQLVSAGWIVENRSVEAEEYVRTRKSAFESGNGFQSDGKFLLNYFRKGDYRVSLEWDPLAVGFRITSVSV